MSTDHSVEGRPLREAELVERARTGDVRAYEELVRRYQGLAQRLAYLVAGGSGEAEDAAQEAFVKAYHALPRFRTGAAFKPWLLRIVANEARNRLRSAGRRVDLSVRAGADRSSGGAAPSPEDSVLDTEQKKELAAALSVLKPEDRLVIGLRYFEQLTEKEMADALGCRQGTVKSRLSRAMGRLRAELQTRSALHPEEAPQGGARA